MIRGPAFAGVWLELVIGDGVVVFEEVHVHATNSGRRQLEDESVAEPRAALSQALAAKYPSAAVEILVCPAFPYLSAVGAAVRGSAVQLGAQNLYFAPQGAFTGEVCGDMLKDVGCGWVLVGHSERRQFFGEQDEVLAKKVSAGLTHGLKVVLCVGELLADRQAGQTEAVLAKQLSGLSQVSAEQMAGVVVAYEPVWAIGTGVTATTEQAQQAHVFLRGQLQSRYGEAVAAAWLTPPEVHRECSVADLEHLLSSLPVLGDDLEPFARDLESANAALAPEHSRWD